MVSLLVIGMLLFSAVPSSLGGECQSKGLQRQQTFEQLPEGQREAITRDIKVSKKPDANTPVEYFDRTKKHYKDDMPNVTQTFVNISTGEGLKYGRVYKDEEDGNKLKFFQFENDERYRTVAKWCGIQLP